MIDHLMIETLGLRKSYGTHTVLDGIDLAVPRGEIFAVLGPNGAGKTTTVGVLTTLIAPNGGTARVGGFDVRRDPAAVRRILGLTGQYAAVDEFQTGRENLVMMSRLAHLGSRRARRRSDDLIAAFDLAHHADKRVAAYSGGLRRRLDLAISLIASPPLVVLDEPTTGLDPRSRTAMWQIVRELAAQGTTILLTTQYLDEADRLADRIAVIDEGRVIATGTPSELKNTVSGEHVVFSLADAAGLAAAGRSPLVADAAVDEQDLTISVATDDAAGTIREFLSSLTEETVVNTISVLGPTLDDVFLALTGHGTRSDDTNDQGDPSRAGTAKEAA